MKKRVILGSVILATIALSACGKKTETIQETSKETASTLESTEKEDASESTGGTGEIDKQDITYENVEESVGAILERIENDEEESEDEEVESKSFLSIPITDFGRIDIQQIDITDEEYTYTTEHGYMFATSKPVGYPKSMKENGSNTSMDQVGIDVDIVEHNHTSIEDNVDEAGGWFIPEDNCHSIYTIEIAEWDVNEYAKYLSGLDGKLEGDPQENVINSLESWGTELEVLPNSKIDKYTFNVGNNEWTCYIGQGDLDKDPEDIIAGVDVSAWTKINDNKFLQINMDYNIDPVIENTLTHEDKYNEALEEIKRIIASFTK